LIVAAPYIEQPLSNRITWCVGFQLLANSSQKASDGLQSAAEAAKMLQEDAASTKSEVSHFVGQGDGFDKAA